MVGGVLWGELLDTGQSPVKLVPLGQGTSVVGGVLGVRRGELLDTGQGPVKVVPLGQGLGQLVARLVHLSPQADQQNVLVTQPCGV